MSVQFRSLDNLETVQVGEFWSRLRDEFPHCEDAPLLGDNFDSEETRVEVVDMPSLRRVRMYNADKSASIQLQPTRFVANWVKVDEATEYPRYRAIADLFDKYLSELESFVTEKAIGTIAPSHLELTYVNELGNSDDKPMQVLEPALNIFTWSHIEHPFLPQPEVVNLGWQFAIPDAQGKLILSISSAQRMDGTKVILLILRCLSGDITENFDVKHWFMAAHECIVRSFTELTTKHAHQEWQREEESA